MVELSEGKLTWNIADSVVDLANRQPHRVIHHGVGAGTTAATCSPGGMVGLRTPMTHEVSDGRRRGQQDRPETDRGGRTTWQLELAARIHHEG
ncbi:hypothetical protein, partial [Nocardioides sp. GCM10030258]|uniref:hypothetical protein n=1 Tax=unclassified Nocardioides TaxID=2615069 RepID=UPI00366E0336